LPICGKPLPQHNQSTAGGGRGGYAGYSQTGEVTGKTKQIANKYLGKNISPEDVISLSTTMPAEAESDIRPLYEVPRSIVQNLLATAASGYGALAKGIQTGSLQQAADVQKEIQQKYGYEPSSPMSQKGFGTFNLADGICCSACR